MSFLSSNTRWMEGFTCDSWRSWKNLLLGTKPRADDETSSKHRETTELWLHDCLRSRRHQSDLHWTPCWKPGRAPCGRCSVTTSWWRLTEAQVRRRCCGTPPLFVRATKVEDLKCWSPFSRAVTEESKTKAEAWRSSSASTATGSFFFDTSWSLNAKKWRGLLK